MNFLAAGQGQPEERKARQIKRGAQQVVLDLSNLCKWEKEGWAMRIKASPGIGGLYG